MSGGISGISGGNAPQVTSGASRMGGNSNKFVQIFQQMDTSNSGSISNAQFETAFNKTNLPAKLQAMGADAIYSKLDPNNTGSVSKQDFISGMRNIVTQGSAGHHHHGGSQASVQGATSPSSTLSSNLQELNATFSTYM